MLFEPKSANDCQHNTDKSAYKSQPITGFRTGPIDM